MYLLKYLIILILKNLQFKTAPQTMSFEIELNKKTEDFARSEAAYYKEISILKLDLQQRDEDLANAHTKHSELKIEIENLNSLLNQKNLDKRNLIQKEYGYDDALISLQNDINDLETKYIYYYFYFKIVLTVSNEKFPRSISLKKDNQYYKDVFQELQGKIHDQTKTITDMERRNSNIKQQLEDSIQTCRNLKTESSNIRMSEQKIKEENTKLGRAIEELMEEAALKTRKEVSELKKIYNANLEKLINECNILETDHSNKEAQLEKMVRAKKSLEQELEKV